MSEHDGLCSRCGLNAPLPEDPDSYCADCASEIDELIESLRERIEERAQSDAYELDDPKHPTYHERYADVWDAREGK